jgi:hypothetical protein
LRLSGGITTTPRWYIICKWSLTTPALLPNKYSESYQTTDPTTGEETTAVHKTDEDGNVSDFLYGVEKDSKEEPQAHGHVWELNQDIPDDGPDPIGGRPPKDAPPEDEE